MKINDKTAKRAVCIFTDCGLIGLILILTGLTIFATELDPSTYTTATEVTANVTALPGGTVKGGFKTGILSGNTTNGYDDNTKLLMYFEGADASTTFRDQCGNTATAINDAQIDTAQKCWGASSCLMDGSDGISVSDAASNFTFGTGDFTIEFWYRANNVVSNQYLIDFRQSSSSEDRPRLYFDAGDNKLYYSCGSVGITGTAFRVAGVWYHIAIVRSSGTTKLYVNGVQNGSSSSDAVNCLASATIRIGQWYGGNVAGVNGWIDEFRISKTARYTATFIPEALNLLSSDKCRIKSLGKQRFNKNTITDEYKIDNSTGALSSSTGDTASDFIQVKYGETLYISGCSNTTNTKGAYYDKSKSYISGFTTYTGALSLPLSVEYIRFTVNDADLSTAILASETTYVDYTETTSIVPVSLQSVSSTIRDTFDCLSGLYTQNVSPVTLNGSLSYTFQDDYTGYKRIYYAVSGGVPNTGTDATVNLVKYNNKSLDYNDTTAASDRMRLFTDNNLYISISDTDTGWLEAWTSGTSFTGMTWGNLIKAYMNGWKLTTANTDVASCVWTGIASGTTKSGSSGYSFVTANIDTGFQPYRMLYQLAKPITKRYSKQPIIAEPSGTMIVEPLVKERKLYIGGIDIKDPNLPISSLASISKVDGGVETPIELSGVSVSSDGKSFSITGATDGDVYEYSYYYSSALTAIPRITYSVPTNKTAQVDENTSVLNRVLAELELLRAGYNLLMDKINNTLKINSTPISVNSEVDKYIDVSLTALNIRDFGQVSFTLIYDPDELEAVDLCTATSEHNLSTGFVSGSDVTITSFSAGTIKFTVNKSIQTGNTWAGVVNGIEFKGKINGTPTLSYTVE